MTIIPEMLKSGDLGKRVSTMAAPNKWNHLLGGSILNIAKYFDLINTTTGRLYIYTEGSVAMYLSSSC